MHPGSLVTIKTPKNLFTASKVIITAGNYLHCLQVHVSIPSIFFSDQTLKGSFNLFLQPRSQGLFPILSAGRGKTLASAGHLPTYIFIKTLMYEF